MNTLQVKNSLVFYVVGISYKKAQAQVRGKFSLDSHAQRELLDKAKQQGLSSLFVISTCNRTEIYGWACHPFELIKLLCDYSNGSVDEFTSFAYVHKGKQAVEHLFNVGCGLDSQILGDFEIISQIKNGFNLSKEKGLANHYLERLVNCVIQASKRVKNETKLCSGATSVSFAAVQYIMDCVEQVGSKNILLFGTGKIGRNTCENLVKHTKNSHISLINRTKEKALEIAGKFNVVVKDYKDLPEQVSQSDILIVATGALRPTIDKTMINPNRKILILDLSMPENVDSNVRELENVELIHLDYLSKVTDRTLEQRKQYIPQAKAIIMEMVQEYFEWYNHRKFAPTLHSLKSKLEQIKDGELDYHRKKMENFNANQAEIITARIIQKITTQFANHLREAETPVEQSIEWIEQVFQFQTNYNE
ncbi:glutamyl-tRNA reductase [Myroides sp. LJL116]